MCLPPSAFISTTPPSRCWLRSRSAPAGFGPTSATTGPFGGQGPPAVAVRLSPTRHGEHPRRVLAEWSGVMQADAYSGYNALYAEGRKPAPILEAACWAHGRRDFFDLARLAKAPIAVEIVRRIDELFAIERDYQRQVARRAARRSPGSLKTPRRRARGLHARAAAAALAEGNVTKAIHYMLSRWASFTRFLDDGRVCLSNNAAERALRCVAVGRRNWTFAGSDEGGRRAAAIYTLVQTCRLNDVDPQAWLADVLGRLPDHPAKRVSELTPWAWKARPDASVPTPPNKPPPFPALLAQHPRGRFPDAYARPASVAAHRRGRHRP